MKKKHPVLISFLVVIAIILGWKSLEKPRQIAFLKRHEKEMTAFIKKYSSEDEEVKFHWETTKSSADVAFSNPVLLIKFDISNSSESKYNGEEYTLSIDTNVKTLKKIKEMTVLDSVIYANIQEERNWKS